MPVPNSGVDIHSKSSRFGKKKTVLLTVEKEPSLVVVIAESVSCCSTQVYGTACGLRTADIVVVVVLDRPET